MSVDCQHYQEQHQQCQDKSIYKIFPPIEGHHPVVRVLFVICSKENAVPLTNRVEEKFPAFQVYEEIVQRKVETNQAFLEKARR